MCFSTHSHASRAASALFKQKCWSRLGTERQSMFCSKQSFNGHHLKPIDLKPLKPLTNNRALILTVISYSWKTSWRSDFFLLSCSFLSSTCQAYEGWLQTLVCKMAAIYINGDKWTCFWKRNYNNDPTELGQTFSLWWLLLYVQTFQNLKTSTFHQIRFSSSWDQTIL